MRRSPWADVVGLSSETASLPRPLSAQREAERRQQVEAAGRRQEQQKQSELLRHQQKVMQSNEAADLEEAIRLSLAMQISLLETGTGGKGDKKGTGGQQEDEGEWVEIPPELLVADSPPPEDRSSSSCGGVAGPVEEGIVGDGERERSPPHGDEESSPNENRAVESVFSSSPSSPVPPHPSSSSPFPSSPERLNPRSNPHSPSPGPFSPSASNTREANGEARRSSKVVVRGLLPPRVSRGKRGGRADNPQSREVACAFLSGQRLAVFYKSIATWQVWAVRQR
mmetsp:Transcript_10013/g.19389  ORF Transcript_10013/g.19389 Transcript_10013/m.19389 type:complete len:282 (+) Transcript_10013:60-905(+)